LLRFVLSQIKMVQMTCALGPDLRKGSGYLKWRHVVWVSYLCIGQHIEDTSLKTVNPNKSTSIFPFHVR